jgi:methionine biosynthesis protein MetW
VEEKSRILVLGCGSGEFIKMLTDEKDAKAFGIDVDSDKVLKAISDGLSVIQGDINYDLSDYPEKSFDYVIAHDIIQIMKKPDQVIRQIISLGKKVIISFPNFAYFPLRLNILLLGRMPKTKILPYEWYDTPNIHLFTIKDFREFCRKEKLNIISEYYTGIGKRSIPKYCIPNLFAEFAYFLLSKKQ